jgi:predicted nucleotidyltransferase component of viral defense system
MNLRYVEQVKLVLDILPFIALEKYVAIKGGTAINLFVRDLPRLSVDIDLTYLPIEPREKSLVEINFIMNRISDSIKRFWPEIVIIFRRTKEGIITGLIVSLSGVTVKIEPNTVLRGTIYPVKTRKLDPAAIKALDYKDYISISVLSVPDLYGGKICAALDRQHPRDLFDIKILFEREGITDEILKAFVVYLACHDRPMHELLDPQRSDMRPAFNNEFSGMTDMLVTCEELDTIREQLVSEIDKRLTQAERHFLFSVKQGEPEWELLDLPGIDRLPALQWKLANIRRMDKAKKALMLEKLKKVLKI